jgi:hypothetical protein
VMLGGDLATGSDDQSFPATRARSAVAHRPRLDPTPKQLVPRSHTDRAGAEGRSG